jgi:hypothetical protein
MIDRPDPGSTGRLGSPMDGKARNLAVEYRPIGSLIPYAKNARTHSDEHVAQIAASIREFGWTNPVLVDGDNGIIAGHGRVLAARKLGMTTVPVIELAGLSEAEKRAYVIADNKIALNAGWDKEMLSVELADLDALGFDLSLTGFGGDELAGLLNFGNRGLTDPDEVPEVPDEPVTRMGDLWVLGRHRLLCGDSTESGDVANVLAGVKPHLMVTDPPYGVSYDPSWRQRFAWRRRKRRPCHRRRPQRRPRRLAGGMGPCSPAMSPTSGTGRCMPARWRPALRPPASPSAPRSSGTRPGW